MRIHFTSEDLARTRLAARPDPMWEAVFSLYRLQTVRGRWAFADWYHRSRKVLAGTSLSRAVRLLLVPILPRAVYFPDFLTPQGAANGLGEGLAAILDTPPSRVSREIGELDRRVGAPAWAPRLADRAVREEFVKVLRAYHAAVIAPYEDRMLARIEGERAAAARTVLQGGTEALLATLSPTMRWRPPVLEVDFVEHRDLRLNGRGLLFVPSYFCWQQPCALADDALPPVVSYPLHHNRTPVSPRPADASLTALLGRTRAAALRAIASGATTSELARVLGVSPGTASHHTIVLREAGLVDSHRRANIVLHTLTPLGAALLRLPSHGSCEA